MSTRILGVGVGVFIIALLWVVAFIVCCISFRTRNNLGLSAVIVAAIVSLILIFIPRESESEVLVDTVGLSKVYDKLFVWRITLVIFLGLSSVAAFIIFLFTHLMEQRRAKALPHWNL